MKPHLLLLTTIALVLTCLTPLNGYAQPVPGAAVLYQTTFDSLTAGEETVADQDGWLGSSSPSPHGTMPAFPDQGQAMYVGSLPFSGSVASLKRPINFAPADTETPVVRFTAEVMVKDSTNGFRDDFGFQIHNSNGDFLAGIIFDNELNRVLVDDGSGPVDTGVSFTKETALLCEMEIYFDDNAWSVWLGGTQVFDYLTFNATETTPTLGDVTVYWAPHDPANSGDNQILIDNWSIIACQYTSMASNGNDIAITDNGPSDPYPATNTITGLTGRLNRLTVRIDGLSHGSADDLDVLLVAPDGRSVVLLSDVGGASDMTSRSVVIDDLAPTPFLFSSLPIAGGRYRPTNYETDSPFPGPAPQGSPLPSLSDLYGMNANGTWRLFIVDDTGGNSGSIDSWSIELGTDGSSDQSFAIWQDTYFSPAEITAGMADWNADADNDGMLNVLEYAFGMNPSGSDNDSPNAPAFFPATVEGVPCLCYQYQRDASKTELTYALEVTSDMVNWAPFTGSDVVISEVGYVQTRQAYIPTSSGNTMIRLRITIL